MPALLYADMPPAAPSSVRLLIVQALSVQPLAEVLEESGYELMRAEDPVAALDGLAAAPQLIVMDMELPELPAEASLALLTRLAGAGVPVIALSRRQDPQRLQTLKAAGASDCLLKPVRLSELLARVERHRRPRPSEEPAQPRRPMASMTVRERDGHCDWQTPQARALMAQYFPPPWADYARLPPEVMAWLHREALRRRAGASPGSLTVAPPAGSRRQRLSFSLMAADAAVIGDGHWLLVLHEADEADAIARLAKALALPLVDAELLYWMMDEADPASHARQLGLGEVAWRERVRRLCEQLAVTDWAQAVTLARRAWMAPE